MAAEYHKRIFEIQQAITKREMHRLELEKELSRVRNRKEANNEKLKVKLRKLKQEVIEEEKKHRRSVEALLNRIKSQKKEYEVLQTRTRHMRTRKDHLAYINSLQNTLNTNPFLYNQVYWPIIKDSSSQTEPEAKSMTAIAGGSELTARPIQQSEVILSGSLFLNSELSRNSQEAIFRSGLPREMQKTEQVRNYYRITPQPEETFASNQPIPHSGNEIPPSLITHNQEIFLPTDRDIHYGNEHRNLKLSQNVDDISKGAEPLLFLRDCSTILPERVSSPKAQTPNQTNSFPFTQNNEDTNITDEVPESQIIPTQNSEIIVEKAEHDNMENSALVDKEEENKLESTFYEHHEEMERSSTLESSTKMIKSEDRTAAKSFKLVSFTPVNKFSETKTNHVPGLTPEVKIHEDAAQKEKISPKMSDNLNNSVNKNTESLDNILREATTLKSGTNTEGLIVLQEEKLPRTTIEITHTDSNSESSHVDDSLKLSPQPIHSSEQISRIDSLKPPATEIFPNSNATSDHPLQLSKTTDKSAKKEKFQYVSDIFDERIPEKPTEAYKQMLRRISHEPLGNDEEITHDKISTELLNYDSESIDSVEAAILAATKGEVAENAESDSPSSTSTGSENKKTVATPSPADEPQVVSRSTSKDDGLDQIKKTFLSKPTRSIDPLKISLDSDSESLSPMSAGDDPSDNDDSFY